MLPEVRLKIQVQGRHPWFYRKMIRRPEEPIPAGSAVMVTDRSGRKVGLGYYNHRTELALRMLTRETGREDADNILVEQLERAIRYRHEVLDLPNVTDGYRLAHAEGDGLPGLILDRLGDAVVAQVFSLCIRQRIDALGEALLKRWPKIQLVMTDDATARKREGFEEAPRPPRIETRVTEHGVRYHVVAGQGHKTGFFADQRDNRRRVGELARGRRVLDLCCNAGGFAIHAARGGARSVRAVDLDEEVVAIARRNGQANKQRIDFEHGDAFDVLREARPGRQDLVVLDPPKWAAGKSQVEDALRRYRDLNRLALQKLTRGGVLATFSCSGAVPETRFLATLRDAAADAGRDARILHQGGAGPDHPVALECPETRYLKAVFLEVR